MADGVKNWRDAVKDKEKLNVAEKVDRANIGPKKMSNESGSGFTKEQEEKGRKEAEDRLRRRRETEAKDRERQNREAAEKRDADEKAASEKAEQDARDRGDISTADAIKEARDKGIGNQYGQRSRFIRNQAERNAKAARQDEIDRKVRDAAIARGDTEFVKRLDAARERRGLPSLDKDLSPQASEAAASDPLAMSVVQEAEVVSRLLELGRIDQAQGTITHLRDKYAGTDYADAIESWIKDNDLDNIGKASSSAAPEASADTTTEDVQRWFPSAVHDRSFEQEMEAVKVLLDRGDYNAANVAISHMYRKYGAAPHYVQQVEDYVNPVYEELAAEQDVQNARVLDALEARGYDTEAMSWTDAYGEYNRLVAAHNARGASVLSPATETYDPDAELDQEVFGASTQAVVAGQLQLARWMEYDPDGELDQGVFGASTQAVVAGQLQQERRRQQLLDYLGGDVDPAFAQTASIEDLSNAALFKERVDDARVRQQLLAVLPDDIDPDFARNAPVESLALLATEQQRLQAQRIDAARFGADPEAGRPSFLAPEVFAGKQVLELAQHETKLRQAGLVRDFPVGNGRTVALNMLNLDTGSPEYQAALQYAEAQGATPVEGLGGRTHGRRNVPLGELQGFTRDANDLQADIALDEQYERDSTRLHTFETAYGPVTFTAAEIDTTDGNKKLSDARSWAQSNDDFDTQDQLDAVESLWQHPAAIARKRRIAAVATVAALALPAAPLAVLGGGALGTGIGGGFTALSSLPDGISAEEWSQIRSSAIEGGFFGAATGGVGSALFSGLTRAGGLVAKGRATVRTRGNGGQWRTIRLADGDAVPPGAEVVKGQIVTRGQYRLSQWAPKQGLNVGSGVGVETGAALIPDRFGRVRVTGSEGRDIALSAVLDPIVDPALSGIGRSATYGARTFAPSKVTLFPSVGPYAPITVRGPGGYDRLTMPAGAVPQLLGPESPEFAEFAHEVFGNVQRQGQWTGVVNGRLVTFNEGRMAQAFRQANPDAPLWYHSSPRTDILSEGPPVMHKEGLSAEEQYLFGAIEPVGKFQIGAAFGGRGEAPGTIVFRDGSIWQRVVDEDGKTKYYLRGYEGEGGISEAVDIPPSERVASGGPTLQGSILGEADVNVPSYPARVRSNLLALRDQLPLVGSGRGLGTQRGRFIYEQLSPRRMEQILSQLSEKERLGTITPGERTQLASLREGPGVQGRADSPEGGLGAQGRVGDPAVRSEAQGRVGDPAVRSEAEGRVGDPAVRSEAEGRVGDPPVRSEAERRVGDPPVRSEAQGRVGDPPVQSEAQGRVGDPPVQSEAQGRVGDPAVRSEAQGRVGDPAVRSEAQGRTETFQRMDPATRADVVQRLDPAARTETLQRMDPATRADVVQRLDPAARTETPQRIDPATRADVVQRLDPAARTETPQRIDPATRADVVQRLDPVTRTEPPVRTPPPGQTDVPNRTPPTTPPRTPSPGRPPSTGRTTTTGRVTTSTTNSRTSSGRTTSKDGDESKGSEHRCVHQPVCVPLCVPTCAPVCPPPTCM